MFNGLANNNNRNNRNNHNHHNIRVGSKGDTKEDFKDSKVDTKELGGETKEDLWLKVKVDGEEIKEDGVKEEEIKEDGVKEEEETKLGDGE